MTSRGLPVRRLVAYLVIGALAVVAFAAWSSGVQDRRGARELATHTPASSRPAVSADDGAVVPAGTDVVASSGMRYWSPTAAVSVGGVVVVSTVVTAPAGGDGTVVVPAPTVRLVVEDREREPWRTNGGPSRRTTPGGTVGFSASFDDVDVEVGDPVTLRLVLDDGSRVDFEGVEVTYRRSSR